MKKGFASMDKKKQEEIARKGGEATSSNREHMAEIGRKGGVKSGEQRKLLKEKKEAKFGTSKPIDNPDNSSTLGS